jgi:periplasmic protein TonB
MELKKNPKVDLRRQSWLFILIGLTIALVLVWVCFESSSPNRLEAKDLGELPSESAELIDVPVTEMTYSPPPPQVQQPEIEEVDDEEEIEDEPEVVFNDNPDEEIKVIAPPKETVIISTGPPKKTEDDNEVFMVVEDPAEPIGGLKAFYAFLSEEMAYPKQAKKMGVEGKVIIEMVVQQDGSLGDFKVLKGLGYGLDEEAIRALKAAPKWKPGKQRGRAVRQRMTIPVTFKLK